MNTNINNTNIINSTNVKIINAIRQNIVTRFARRAATVLAFAGLLALSHQAAKADVVVEKFVGPQGVYNDTDNFVNPGVTALQLKVHNTNNYAVTSVPVQTYVYLNTDVNNGWQVRAMPATNVSLAAGQSKWISIFLPNTSLQGQSLRGKYLYAKALMNGHEYWLNNFLDAAYTMDAIETNRTNNPDGGVSFTIKFTNLSHIPSPQMTITDAYAPYAGGDLGPKKPVSAILPQLQPGQVYSLTFTTAPLGNQGYDFLDSDLYIGTDIVFYQFRL